MPLALAGMLDARNGFSEHLPCGWIVRHGRSIHRKIKPLSLDQLTVAHRVGRISAADREHAIFEDKLASVNTKPSRRQLVQRVARGIDSDAQAVVAELRRSREAANGEALIGSDAAPAQDQRDALHRHRQFFGGKLNLQRAHTGAEFSFTRENRDALVGADGNPVVHLSSVNIARGVDRALRVGGAAARQRRSRSS